MSLVSTPYLDSGRTRQKQRTRADLIEAARALIARGGGAPTVEQAAAAASVSRTTAYRYFPSQQALLVAAHPETHTSTLLPPDVGDDPEVRLRVAVQAFNQLIVESEQQQRTMLRLSLDERTEMSELPLRKGRAVGWFEDALSVLQPGLSPDEVRRVAIAVRSVAGIETLVWLVDVAGYTRTQACATMEWSALSVLRRAMAGDLP